MPTKCEGRGPGQPCTLGKDGQPRQPTYAAPGSNKPTRCATCRLEGYHDVRSRRCEGTVAPSASPEEAAHAARIPCTSGKNGTAGRPCYAPPGSDKPTRCAHCKLPDWHSTRKAPACEGSAPGQPCTHGLNGRPAWPSFAAPGERRPRRCARCVPDVGTGAPWPNVRSYPQCEGRGDGKPCTNGAGGKPARSSWAPPGGVKAMRCAHCRGPDWVSRRSKTLCEGDVEAGKPCTNGANGGPCRPSFAAPGKTKPTRCSQCRRDGYHYVASRMCEGPGGGAMCAAGRGGNPCTPSYVPPDSKDGVAIRCATCRGPDWRFVSGRQCEGPGGGVVCRHGRSGQPARPSYAPPGGSKALRCAHCKLDNWSNTVSSSAGSASSAAASRRGRGSSVIMAAGGGGEPHLVVAPVVPAPVLPSSCPVVPPDVRAGVAVGMGVAPGNVAAAAPPLEGIPGASGSSASVAKRPGSPVDDDGASKPAGNSPAPVPVAAGGGGGGGGVAEKRPGEAVPDDDGSRNKRLRK